MLRLTAKALPKHVSTDNTRNLLNARFIDQYYASMADKPDNIVCAIVTRHDHFSGHTGANEANTRFTHDHFFQVLLNKLER